jgi:hypothetical protein
VCFSLSLSVIFFSFSFPQCLWTQKSESSTYLQVSDAKLREQVSETPGKVLNHFSPRRQKNKNKQLFKTLIQQSLHIVITVNAINNVFSFTKTFWHDCSQPPIRTILMTKKQLF